MGDIVSKKIYSGNLLEDQVVSAFVECLDNTRVDNIALLNLLEQINKDGLKPQP